MDFNTLEATVTRAFSGTSPALAPPADADWAAVRGLFTSLFEDTTLRLVSATVSRETGGVVVKGSLAGTLKPTYRALAGSQATARFRVDAAGHAQIELALMVPSDAPSGLPTLFTVLGPMAAPTDKTSAECQLTLAGHRLDAWLTFPDLVFGAALDDGENHPIDLTEILEDIAPGAFPNLGLHCTELRVSGDSTQGTYRFQAALRDDWAFDLLGRRFALTKVDFDLTHQTSPRPATYGRTSARVEVAGVPFVLSAIYDSRPADDAPDDAPEGLSAARPPGKDAGWVFSGSSLGSALPIGDLVADLGKRLGVATELPAPIASLELRDLHLFFDTRSKNFAFRGSANFDLGAGKPAELTLSLELVANPAGYEKRFGGLLRLGEGDDALDFELIFDTDPTSTTLLAVYADPDGGELSVAKLVQAATGDTVPGLENLHFGIKSALFAYETGGGGGGPGGAKGGKYLFALEMDAGIELSRLPLVGQLLPPGEGLRLVFAPLIVSGSYTPQELASLAALLPSGAPALPTAPAPAGGLGQGLHLLASLEIGDETIPLELPVALDTKSGQVRGSSGLGAGSGAGQTVPALPGGQRAGADGVHWFDCDKTLGPVHFARVGLELNPSSETLGVLLDGSLHIAGLELGLQGLGASYSLKNRKLDFHLHGLGLDYRQGPLEIGAAFLNSGDDFAGKALLRTQALSISALGAFASPDGQPSLFVYAFLDDPIGGPSFFFVEGLGLGFGYNRRFTAPPIEQVDEFPMVQEAMADLLPEPDLEAELVRLHEYITPSMGDYFLAAGLKFSSFKLIDAFALLAVSFGRHFEIDLLAVATVTTPSRFPIDKALGAVVLDLAARFDPTEGYLGVEAQLDEKKAFLLSHDCHLHGGFALSCWFRGEHAGDFVVSLGGYHPQFSVPAHYPRVPRVDFSWQVSPHLSLKGGGYFALTPSAAMAGGSLEAVWADGHLSAHFVAGADFLVSWKPYHYQGRAAVEISAHYRGFSTHADASLEMWGPDFSGHAHIDWTVLSFDIYFGEGSREAEAIDWDEFKLSFLPADEGICSVQAQAGLVRSLEMAGGKERWVLDPKTLRLSTDSVIPAKKGVRDPSAPQDLPPGHGATVDFGIAPMDLAASALPESTHGIRIVRLRQDGPGQVAEDPATDDFRFEPVVKSFPNALWGQSKTASENTGRRMVSALAGYELSPHTPVASFVSVAVTRKNLAYEVTELPMGEDPPAARATYDAEQLKAETRDDDGPERQALRDALRTSHGRRVQVLGALGFDPSREVDLSGPLADSFVVPPRRLAFATP